MMPIGGLRLLAGGGVIFDVNFLQHAYQGRQGRKGKQSSKRYDLVARCDWRRKAAGCKPRNFKY
jgi:hypothetical protein